LACRHNHGALTIIYLQSATLIELLPVERDAFAAPDLIQLFSIICAWTGEKDLACEQLAIATQFPGYTLAYGGLCLLPFWDPLRGDPRFEKIVASLAPSP
jgi:hypothetical protein